MPTDVFIDQSRVPLGFDVDAAGRRRETAEPLHVSADTVMRDWRLAKALLVRELSGEQLEGG